MSKQSVITALRVLRHDAPEYFNDAIMGDCPCDLGLPATYRKWCGMENIDDGFTSEYCKRCWSEALGDEIVWKR